MVDLENQPGIRIPMSVGKLKEDHDKSKNRIFEKLIILKKKIV